MTYLRLLASGVVLLASFCIPAVAADTNVWTGTNNFTWSNGGGWSLGHSPQAGETVAITNRTLILDGETERMASFVITRGTLLFTNWTATLNADTVEIGNGGVLTLPSAFTNGPVTNRINVICNDFLVQTGGTINADSRGFAGNNGPGISTYPATAASGGAGHGGIGGISAHGYSGGIVYGTASNPVIPGSGASKTYSCAGGPGGGAIRIEATGALTVHGTISANGGAGGIGSSRDGGGGSGGSILLLCNTFSGTGGTIRANGARTSSLAGGGGGGRIALHYAPAAQALVARPDVTFAVHAGGGYSGNKDRFQMADWGTLFFSDASGVFCVSNTIAGFSGHLVISGGAAPFSADSLTLTNAYLGFDQDSVSFQITNSIMIYSNAGIIGRRSVSLLCGEMTNAGLVKLGSNSALTAGGNVVMPNSELSLQWGSTLAVSGSWMTTGASALASFQGVDAGVTGRIVFADGASLTVLGAPTNDMPGAWGARLETADDLLLERDSWIYPFSDAINGGSPLFLCNRLLVDSTSGFNGDGRGYAQNKGPGAGPSGWTEPAAGGGHGGRGGTDSFGHAGGATYGDRLSPIHAGSGGGFTASSSGGAGGGVIRIEAADRIVLNGFLTANGLEGGVFVGREGGGGAGGSINLTCGAFAGTGGVIRADGGRSYGTGAFGGAGAGGRIALQYDPVTQAGLEKPSVQFSARAGHQLPIARQWLMADYGTLCFPDTDHIFTIDELITDFSGYLVLTNELSLYAVQSLTLSNAVLGFDTVDFAYQIPGSISIASNAGLIGRWPQSISCASLTNLGILRFGTNSSLSITGSGVISNSFCMRSDSAFSVGQDLTLAGPASLMTIEGMTATVGQNLLIQSGAVFSAFAKATNATPRAWGARLTVQGDVTLESGGWIHPYSESINGGSPLLQCRNMVVSPNSGINADSKGFIQNKGPGPGGSAGTTTSAGGGHGGRGGNSSSGRIGGSSNGLLLFPLNAGSGGGSTTSSSGGTGGGVIRVEAENAITLNGTFTANGGNGGASAAREAGGGAGGGIFVIARSFSGGTQGLLSARGGNGPTSSGGTVGGGGGGGGRIAIWTRAIPDTVAAAESNTNRLAIASSLPSYDGSAAFDNGAGWQAGANGTLVFVSFKSGALILVR